jgi:hypothetical protein
MVTELIWRRPGEECDRELDEAGEGQPDRGDRDSAVGGGAMFALAGLIMHGRRLGELRRWTRLAVYLSHSSVR